MLTPDSSFATCAHEHLLALGALNNRPESTVDGYRSDLNGLRLFLEQHGYPSQPAAIDKVVLTLFFTDCRKVKENADVTVARKFCCFKVFFAFLKRRHVIESDPLEGEPKPSITKRLPRPMTEQEVCDFLNAIDLEDPFDARMRAFYELKYGSGLRISECCNLRKDALIRDGDTHYVTFIGKGNKERRVPVTQEFLDALAHYRNIWDMAHESPWMFVSRRGTPLCPVVVQLHFKKILKRAGLPMKYTPHCLRHSFATHAMQHGANIRYIQEALGHANLGTTELYLKVANGDVLIKVTKVLPRPAMDVLQPPKLIFRSFHGHHATPSPRPHA